MTQALNLANFANNLNTSGATSNAGLQNSSVTVTAGTGLSGGGVVSLGGAVSLANAGVTSFNGLTGAVTYSASGISSITAGNGLTGGTITTSGTIALDVYTGSSSTNTSFPIGSHLEVDGQNGGFAPFALNSSASLYANGNYFVCNSGSALAGTWRNRGNDHYSSNSLFQRTA
jgi:hypothetical protein